jgi:hypothetical protein
MILCKRCGKKFIYKSQLIKHLNSTRECTMILSKLDTQLLIDELENDKSTDTIEGVKYYICKYCKKKYKSAAAKCNHIKNCKLKQSNENDNENELNIELDIQKLIQLNGNFTPIQNNQNKIIINENCNNDNSITINQKFNQNIFNFNDVNHVNSLINYHKINNAIFSFPTYTIGHILEDDSYKLKKSVTKCKYEDMDSATAYRSHYSLVLDLFKEILSVKDYRTKNIYINDKNDNIAYCFLEGSFYSIEIENLFNIIFQHLPNLINHLKKIKDRFNGMNKDDKEYTEFACQQFNDFLKNDDKTVFKQEIINCIYNNKLALQELLNSSKPMDEILLNNTDLRTITINTNSTNKLRKSFGLIAKDAEINEQINIEQKEIKYRPKTSVEIIDSEKKIDDYKIIIDYDKATNRRLPDGKILYRTKYNGIDIWYNEIFDLGCLGEAKSRKLVSKKVLCETINDFINNAFDENDSNDLNDNLFSESEESNSENEN